MRRTMFLIFILTLLVTAVYFVRQNNLKNPQPVSIITPTPTIIITPTPKTTFKVTKVIDGDTIIIDTGEKVRLIGVDAPELEGEKSCYSEESKKYLQELIENKDVILEKDISEVDKYDRLLRYISIGDTFVNDNLLSNGYAVLATYPPDIRYVEQFKLSSKMANNQQIGLYGACQN